MKTNEELQKDVQDAIKWEPLLNAAEIGVTAKDGVITLTGSVNSYAKKSEAEMATKNVAGVKAVVEKIEIKFGSDWAKKDDNEIATEVLNAIKWDWEVPSDKIKVKVEKGWITLEGDVTWNFQKNAAKNVADKTRKASAYAALWFFISLLVGAFAASLSATYGGRRRDL